MSTLPKATLMATVLHVTSVARQRLVRPRRGFAEFVAPLLALYDANIEQLRIDGVEPTVVLETLRKYEALAADEASASATLARIKDERLQLSSSVWKVLLEIYARVRTFARTNDALRLAIADFETFMKRGPTPKTTKATQATQATQPARTD